MNDDDRLNEGFAKLRRHDARRAPTFDAIRSAPARARARSWVVALPVAATGLAAAAVVALWLRAQPDASPSVAAPAEPVPAAAAGPAPAVAAAIAPSLDPAPLDFLLSVPGQVSLATAPDFDRSLLQGRRR
jgi:hypothetical protein